VFAKTSVSAMSQLSITLDPGGDYISLLDSSMLGTGLRFTTVLPEPGTLVMLFIATVLLPRRRVTA
jgi:hypothetical protein